MRKTYLFMVLFLFASYIFFIIQLAKVVIYSCITEIISAGHGSRAIETLVANPKFYVYLITIGLFCFLIIRIVYSILKLVLTLIKTNIFITRLEVVAFKQGAHVINSEQKLAFTAGFLRPKIYVSRGLVSNLTEEEYQQVINHEMSHVVNKDTFTKLIVESILIAIPVSSVAPVIKKAFLNMIESFASESAEIALKFDSIRDREVSIASYTETDRTKTRKLFIASFIIFISMISIFVFFGSKVYAHRNLTSICTDKSSCELLQSNSEITGMPTQCAEVLYSPAINSTQQRTNLINFTSSR